MRELARNEFKWKDRRELKFENRTVCKLIPHNAHKNHYHLKFEWRAENTPEFFNLTNAKENGWSVCRKHYQEKLLEPRT